jgi:imidazolonepropionase-like amidohydrolase
MDSEKYQNELKNSPAFAKNMKAFDIAKQNLKKVFDAGIPVAMGTDSGAMPLRAQGFSEHLELQLMTESGLTPLQAITVATKNSAKALKIDKDFGTIETGKMADFIILNSDPSKNIKNTRDIFLVYKAGKEVSKGPIAK